MSSSKWFNSAKGGLKVIAQVATEAHGRAQGPVDDPNVLKKKSEALADDYVDLLTQVQKYAGRTDGTGPDGAATFAGLDNEDPPPDPRNPNNPVWLQKAFIGEFGDNYVGDTELEGGHTAPSIRYLLEMATHAMRDRRNLLKLFSDEEFEKLETVLDHMEAAADAGDFLNESNGSPERLVSYLKHISSQFDHLLPGELLVLPGGWHKNKGGHAIIYIIERTSEDTFSWVVINTGNGIHYHPSTAEFYPKTKYKTAIRLDNIHRDRLLDEAFLYTVFKLQLTRSDDNNERVLYEVALPHLAKSELSTALATDDPYVAWETPQAAGVCYYRCILSAIRYLMRWQGLSQGHVKQFLYALRRAYVMQCEIDLKECTALYNSHICLVELACKQVARSSLKEHEAERLDLPGLDAAKAQIDRVHGMMSKITVRGENQLQQPQLKLTEPKASGGTLVQSGASALTAHNDEAALDQLAGDRTEDPPIPFVDLCAESLVHWHPDTAEAPTGNNFRWGTTTILQSLLDTCDDLRKQEGSTPCYRVSALITHVFTEVLPVPNCPGAGDSSEHAAQVWAPVKMTWELQQQTCHKIMQVAKEYLAAVLSNALDPIDDGRRLITMGAMLAAFHSVITAETIGRDEAAQTLNKKDFRALRHIACEDGIADHVVNAFENTPQHQKEMVTLILDKREQVVNLLRKNQLPSKLGAHSFGSYTAALQFDCPADAIFRSQLCEYFAHCATQPCEYRAFDQPKQISENDFNYMFYEKLLSMYEQSDQTHYHGCAPDHEFEDEQTHEDLSKTDKLAGWYVSNASPSSGGLTKRITLYRDFIELYKFGGHATTKFGSGFKYGSLSVPTKLYKVVEIQLSLGDGGADKPRELSRAWREAELKDLPPPLPPSSPASVQAHAKGCRSEDDVLHASSLPSFGDKVESEAAERLLSFLSVPYMRLPLICAWFADSRIGCFFNEDMRRLFDAALLEPGNWVPASSKSCSKIPAPPGTLGCASGTLLHELMHAPRAILDPMLELLENAITLCIGGHTSAFVELFLHVFRALCRIEDYLLCAKELCENSSADCVAADIPIALGEYASKLKTAIRSEALPVVLNWMEQAERAGDKHIAARMHAHVVLMNRNDKTPNAESIGVFLGSAGYLLSYHTAGVGAAKQSGADDDGDKDDENGVSVDMSANSLFVPDSLVFQAMEEQREIIAQWFATADASEQMDALNAFLRVATVSPEFRSDTFEHIGPGIADAQATFAQHSDSFEGYNKRACLQALVECGMNARQAQACVKRDESSLAERYEEACASSPLFMLGGYECNVQTATVKFGAAALKAVPETIARDFGFQCVFNGEAPHCALVSLCKHRRVIHIAGRGFTIARWEEMPKNDVILGIPATQRSGIFQYGGFEFDPSGHFYQYDQPKGNHELSFLREAMDAVLLTECSQFANGKYTWAQVNDIPVCDLKFLMPVDIPHDCIYVPLLLQVNVDKQQIWKEFRVFRHRKLVEVFNLVESGRCAFPHQVYSSDTRCSFADLPVDTQPRSVPRATTTVNAGGDPFSNYSGSLISTIITRNGAVNETLLDKFVCLYGVIPQGLLEKFEFWRTDTEGPTIRIKGYPVDDRGRVKSCQEGDQMLEVLISSKTGEILVHSFTPIFGSPNSWQADIVDTVDSKVYINLSAAEPLSTLFQLGELFARVENFSHVLAWTKENAADLVAKFKSTGSVDTGVVPIDDIELPRLKSRFAVKRVSETETRCYSIDASGFWVSNRTHPSIDKLRRGLPFALLLENREGELQLWTPAYSSTRPKITYLPFSTRVVGNRRSATSLNTRVYMYPVHCSMTYCSFPTTASLLHYALQVFLHRDYPEAAKLAAQASIDASLSREEFHLLDRFASTMDDKHPDAFAVRLKLRLATLHSDTEICVKDAAIWPSDYIEYIQKLAHVSVECRLTHAEEMLLLSNLQEMKTVIMFNDEKKSFWANARGVGEADGANTVRGSTSPLKILTARFKVRHAPLVNRAAALTGQKIYAGSITAGGKYWDAALKAIDGLHDGASWIEFLKYKRPEGDYIGGTRALDVADKMLKDDVSGNQKKLGPFFCYELLMGKVKMSFVDRTPSVLSSVRLASLLVKTMLHKYGDKLGSSQLTLWGGVIQMIELLDADEPIADAVSMQEAVDALECPELVYDGHQVEWLGDYGTGWAPMATWLIEDEENRKYSHILHDFIEAWKPKRKELCAKDSFKAAIERGSTSAHVHGVDCDSAVVTEAIQKLQIGIPHLTDCNAPSQTLQEMQFGCVGIDSTTAEMLASHPLSCLEGGLEPFVELHENSGTVDDAVPFDLSAHKDAGSKTAEEMLNRIKDDMAKHASMSNTGQTAALRCISPRDMNEYRQSWKKSSPERPAWAGKATSELNKLLTILRLQLQKDQNDITAAIIHVETQANLVDSDLSHDDALQRIRHHLLRAASQRTAIDFEFLAGSILSSKFSEDLQAINPFLTVQTEITQATGLIMFTAVRINQLQRCVGATEGLIESISSAVAPGYLQKGIDALVGNLYGERAYIKQTDGSFKYDACYLGFEYLTGFLLRASQVHLVDTFYNRAIGADEESTCTSMVHQMIMGAGKTTCIAPLLSMKLADGTKLVSLVCPAALLQMSRNQLWKFFARVVKKAIYTYTFGRSSCSSVSDASKLLDKLRTARSQRAIVVATPTAIKSTLLKYLDLLNRASQLKQHDAELKEMLEIADVTAHIMSLWGKEQDGVLILDEVDALLHPLRSELNFPIGQKRGLDMGNGGDQKVLHLRWELPIHLLDAVFFAKTGLISSAGFAGASTSSELVQLKRLIEQGTAEQRLMTEPHVVLLDRGFYMDHMVEHLALWLEKWLRERHLLAPANDSAPAGELLSTTEVVEYMLEQDNSSEELKGKLASLLTDGVLSEHAVQVMNLGHDWLVSFVPHVMTKIDRVTFGILQPDDRGYADTDKPASRKLCAVPFAGKDCPSEASEFAQPDVLIGMSIMAYRYEGLRMEDLRTTVAQLQTSFQYELGPKAERASARMFDDWVKDAKESQCLPSVEVMPLEFFERGDQQQMDRLFKLLRLHPPTIHHYLCTHVFPSVTDHKSTKLSASGSELGGAILFGTRLGFSGTPSSLLPTELQPCQFEAGSEGKIIHTLTNPDIVTCESTGPWTVTSLLDTIALREPAFSALIDTGALVTGLSNEQVARYLLDNGLKSMEGVVYLRNTDDEQMILLRGREHPILLKECGLSNEKRFTFYDQVHTVGIDVKQALNATAVVTLGKDMTMRDYAQGCYRMRGIGQGQLIHLMVIPEIEALIQKELGPAATGRMEVDAVAWLHTGTMRMERMQFMQLCSQNSSAVWRKRALDKLFTASGVQSRGPNEVHSNNLKRFQHAEVQHALDIFLEDVDFSVEKAVPVAQPLAVILKQEMEAHVEFIETPEDQAVLDQIFADATYTGASAGGVEVSLGSEMTREREQEKEQQKEQEQEVEKEQEVEYARDSDREHQWSAELLHSLPTVAASGGDTPEAIYRTSGWRVLGELEESPTAISFSENLLQTDNFVALEFDSDKPRRVKSVNAYLQMKDKSGAVCFVIVSLAEAETVRRIIHEGSLPADFSLAIRLMLSSGDIAIDSFGPPVTNDAGVDSQADVSTALSQIKFLDNSFYFSHQELVNLLSCFDTQDKDTRRKFFDCLLRTRTTRARSNWFGTPVSKVFQMDGAQDLMELQALVVRVGTQIRESGTSIIDICRQVDEDGNGYLDGAEIAGALRNMNLDLSESELRSLVAEADKDGNDFIEYSEFAAMFNEYEIAPPTVLPALTPRSGDKLEHCRSKRDQQSRELVEIQNQRKKKDLARRIMEGKGAEAVSPTESEVALQKQVMTTVAEEVAAREEAEARMAATKPPTVSLWLSVMRAEGLAIADRYGSDPYAVVKLDGKKVFQTSTIANTTAPTWNESTVEAMDVIRQLPNEVNYKDTDGDLVSFRLGEDGGVLAKYSNDEYSRDVTKITLDARTFDLRDQEHWGGCIAERQPTLPADGLASTSGQPASARSREDLLKDLWSLASRAEVTLVGFPSYDCPPPSSEMDTTARSRITIEVFDNDDDDDDDFLGLTELPASHKPGEYWLDLGPNHNEEGEDYNQFVQGKIQLRIMEQLDECVDSFQLTFSCWPTESEQESALAFAKKAFGNMTEADFERFDTNCDGTISREEIAAGIERHQCVHLSTTQLDLIMALADKDGDGSVSLEEFQTIGELAKAEQSMSNRIGRFVSAWGMK